jgi:hypothetical protein
MKPIVGCAALALLFCTSVTADQLPLGVSPSHRLFIQEYWKDGRAYYGIINLADKEVTVSVSTPDGTRAGPWKIAARESKSFPLPAIKNVQGYMRVEKDGNGIGLLEVPVDSNVPKEKGELTCVGYNGNGGRDPKLWMVQKQDRYQAGDAVEVTFVIQATDGLLEFARADDDRLPAGQVFLSPIDVTSETLHVKKTDEKFVVTLVNPKKIVAWHRVTVRFRAPEVRTLKSGVIMGTWWNDAAKGGFGSGHVLARSVVLAPKEAAQGKPLEKDWQAVETANLQGAWDCYRPKTANGVLLLVHGNRVFVMRYEDDERLELVKLATDPRQAGADTFVLQQQEGKRYLVLKSGGRLEYRLENGVLTIVQPAARADIWGSQEMITGQFTRGRRRRCRQS